MILANANGELSQNDLLRKLCCGQETLERRASELGLKLQKYVYLNSTNKPKPRVMKDPQSGEVFSGYHEVPHVGDDLLLQRLYQHYGERRYESLVFNKDQANET